MSDKTLNDVTLTKKKIGSDNFRFQCDSIVELQKRIKIKEKFKREGYADALDCKVQIFDPLYTEIMGRRPKEYTRQARVRVTKEMHEAIFILLHHEKVSLRSLEAFFKLNNFKIAKSTLHRWVKQYKETQSHLTEKPATHIPNLKKNLSKLLVEDIELKNSSCHPINIIKKFILIQRFRKGRRLNCDVFLENL